LAGARLTLHFGVAEQVPTAPASVGWSRFQAVPVLRAPRDASNSRACATEATASSHHYSTRTGRGGRRLRS